MKKNKLFYGLMILALQIPAHAQEKGNGGLSYVCRNPKSDAVEAAYFVDLDEAVTYWGLELIDPKTSEEQTIALVKSNLQESKVPGWATIQVELSDGKRLIEGRISPIQDPPKERFKRLIRFTRN